MTTETYGDSRGAVFRPRYRPVAWIGLALPALVGLGLAAVSTALGVPSWGVAALAALPLPAPVLLAWLFWYRRVELGPERIALRRPLFPDVVEPWERVEGLGSGSFVLGDRPVPWRLFRNGERLAGHLRRLRWDGVVDAERIPADEEKTVARRRAALGAVAIGAGGIGGSAAAGASPGAALLTGAVLALLSYPLAGVLLYGLGAGAVAASGVEASDAPQPGVGAGVRREVA